MRHINSVWKKIISAESSKVLGIEVITKILSFAILPIYLHLMSKNSYGEFTFVYSAIMSSLAIVSLGIYIPLIKLISSELDKEKILNTYGSCLVYFFILCTSICILISSLNFFEDQFASFFSIKELSRDKFIFVLGSFIFMTLNFITNGYLIGSQKYNLLVLFIGYRFFSFNLISIITLQCYSSLYDESLIRFFALFASEISLALLSLGFIFRGQYSKFAFIPITGLLRLGFPMIFANAFYMVTSLSDKYFLANTYNLSHVANYNLSLQLAGSLQMIMSVAHSMWQPKIFSIQNSRDVITNSRRFFLFSVLGLLFCSIAIICITKICINFQIIPEKYNNLDQLIILACLSFSITMLLQIPFNIMIKYDGSKTVAIFTFFIMIFTIISGLLIVPEHGDVGALLGSVVIGASALLLTIPTLRHMLKLAEADVTS